MKDKKTIENLMKGAIIFTGILLIFNQVQLSAINASFNSMTGATSKGSIFFASGNKKTDLSKVDVTEITSTAMAIATLFPELGNLKTEEDAISMMISTGTPEYSEALGGITFDDPAMSMEYLAKWYHSSNSEIKKNYPEIWQRYLNLAAAPRGISCEFCCGLNAQGITAEGKLMCGCKHQPALLAVAMGLMQNTDYSDAQVLKEAMKWKTIWFPRNMVGLAMEVAGTDPSSLKELPGMVGGC